MVGGGTAGVVLVHQYPADLCGFWPYSVYLAHKGLRVLDLDVRCYGRSSCPQGDARGHVADDVAAAAAELRHRGATRIALVGASSGRLIWHYTRAAARSASNRCGSSTTVDRATTSRTPP
jgi:pimeloyl-ACP methyl ester carboxylesterase